MKQFWKKQLPAALLALIMMVSLVPLAGAEEPASEPLSQPETEADAKAMTLAEHTHSYPDAWTADDATNHSRTCMETGCTVKEIQPHNYGGWTTVQAATCYRDGVERRICSICGYEETRSVTARPAHTYGNWGYKNNSVHSRVCTVLECRHEETQAHTHAAADTGTVTQKATCTSPGIRVYTCTVCAQSYTEAIPATGHKVDPNTGKCTVCGQQINNVGYRYTVNYYYLISGSNGLTTTDQTISNVPANNYAGTHAPATPNVTYGGTTYTFKGWTTVPYSGSTGYLYSNQSLITNMFTYPITGNFNFYAVYTTNGNTTISYSVDPGKKVNFSSLDFYNAYRNQYNGVLNYVTFSVNQNTYENFTGVVYVGNSVLSYSSLTASRFYYNRTDASWSDFALEDLSLQAGPNARNESIVLNFTAYGSWGTLSGTVKLTVNGTNSRTIIYNVTPGRTVNFDRDDFDAVFRTQYPGETVGYVVFDYPSSTAFSYGTLYSNYGSGTSQTRFTRSDLGNATFYYNSGYVGGWNDYALDNLTFVAESVFKDTVTLTFTAYAINNTSRKVTGKVEIRSSDSTADSITYKVTPGRAVTVSRTDFLNFLRKTYSNETLDRVIFDLPDTNAFAYGTLYGNYNMANQIAFSRSDLSSYSFYYEAAKAINRYSCPLDNLTFVADSRFATPVKLTFTAYDDDTDYVRGTLIFQPDGTTAVSNYVGNIRYSVTTGTSLQINANDIARYFNKTTGGTLQYVTLTGVPSTGSLYYNYYGASKYGSAARMQLTSANAGMQPLYFNPASTAQYALTELTYVPSGSNYCVSIPFTAYGSNYGSTTGTILISVSRSAVPEVYGVTSKNTAVNFPASGIYSAVLSATGSPLYSIQLLSLPASSVGTVYVGSGTSVRANTTTQYTYASGTNSISQLRFVPVATYTGSVEIPYVALNSSGVAIASGLFSLGVVNSRKSFSDVGASTWCYKYVTELSDAGVIDGYANGAFKPNNTISYGAALKLIMLAAGYPELAPTDKNSVFSGYLARAQADGLVTRSNVNLSAPITRLQVAQLAAGALKLNTSNLSSVKPFTDTSDLYVQALNAAGIVEGYFSNGTSTFKPNNTLTRGQVSAIVWRMQNYRK